MIVAVNYADQPWRKAQRLNTRTAYKKGKVDRVEEYTRDDIAEDFWKKNQGILEKPRGGGYWLWKPYVVNRSYEKLQQGDYLIYTDAGGFYYTGDVHDATKWMEEHNIWLLVNDMVFLEKQYTKRDVFIYLNRDELYYTDSPQCMGGLFIIKKCQTGDTFCLCQVNVGNFPASFFFMIVYLHF